MITAQFIPQDEHFLISFAHGEEAKEIYGWKSNKRLFLRENPWGKGETIGIIERENDEYYKSKKALKMLWNLAPVNLSEN